MTPCEYNGPRMPCEHEEPVVTSCEQEEKESLCSPPVEKKAEPQAPTWRCGSMLLRPKAAKGSQHVPQGTHIYHIGDDNTCTIELLVGLPGGKASCSCIVLFWTGGEGGQSRNGTRICQGRSLYRIGVLPAPLLGQVFCELLNISWSNRFRSRHVDFFCGAGAVQYANLSCFMGDPVAYQPCSLCVGLTSGRSVAGCVAWDVLAVMNYARCAWRGFRSLLCFSSSCRHAYVVYS